MYDKAYHELYKGYRGPETPDECEYFIRKLYRQLKRAYTVEEAKAIIEEIYKYKNQNTEREFKMALISIKDVKQAIKIMMQILEKLDEIYHALHDSTNEEEKE